MTVVALLLDGGVNAQNATSAASGLTVHNRSAVQETGVIDFANAKAMPLATADLYEADRFSDSGSPTGTPGFVRGAQGDGRETPTFVPLQKAEPGGGFGSAEFGTSNHVFTTSRVDLAGSNVSALYPYRAAGKLYFNIGSSTFVCSASLIKRGVIVTAAHCVTAFGGAFYTNWRFVPALAGTSAPYGTWTWAQAVVMTSYKNGTDFCAPGARGIVCRNDIAVIRLAPQGGAFPGTRTGWFGYGWNGYGFNPQNLALINQLGYPVSHDSGNRMQRTDSEGFVGHATNFAGNTIWGSRQTGGASGGPELVNLGAAAALSGGVLYGAEAAFNTVVGVTSWGYVNQAVKQLGASPFTSSNIVPLVNTTCGSPAVPACR
jgi:hypothetical protein